LNHWQMIHTDVDYSGWFVSFDDRRMVQNWEKNPWAGEWPHMANRRVSLGLKSWPKPTWKGHHAQFLSPWRRPNRSMTESIHATPSYSARFVQDVSKWTVTGSPISPSSCSCSKLVNKIHF
jgi:hypothetical protein